MQFEIFTSGLPQVQADCVGPLLEKATAQAAAAVSFKHV